MPNLKLPNPSAQDFYLQVLNPCLKQLPLDAKTRQNNFVHTFESAGILPTYYRFYDQDILVLSTH